MNTADIVELLGKLLAGWCVGFSAGFLITRFKEAMQQAV